MPAPGDREARLLRNTGYLLAAFLLQKPLSFLYFNFLAGKLGVTLLGRYTALHDVIPIALIAIDFSLSVVVVREIAKKPENAQSLLSNAVGAKIIFALIAFALGGAATAFGPFSSSTQSLLYLVAAIVALDTFTLTFYSVFRGLQNMRFESLGVLGTQLVSVLVGFILLGLGFGLTAAFLSILIGSVFNFALAATLLRKRANLKIRPAWDWPVIRLLLLTALPFAATAALVKLFIYTDRYILLGASHGATFPVGVYITAHKWTYTFEFFPSALAAALLPAMSEAFVHSKERLVYLFERSLHYLLIIAAPLLVGIYILGDRILAAFLPHEFQAAVAPLRILVFAIPWIFLNYPVGTLLNATNRQLLNTLSMGIALVVNLVLNIALVRHLSYNGTAIATLVSTFVLLVFGFIWIARFLPVPWMALTKNALKAVVAAGAMGLVIAGGRGLLPLPALIATGVVVYALALAAVGGVTKEDARALLSALRGRGFGTS